MSRLFIAVRPPPAIRGPLLAQMGGVSGARWQDDGQLHLTLRFLGEVDRHTARDVDAALASLRHSPIEARIAGVGLFEKRGRVDTLWAGVAPLAPLKALHDKVEQAVARAGLPPEHRVFHPHITLARLGRGSGPVHGFVAAHADLASPPFAIERIGLFESHLMADGAVYEEIAGYDLA